MQTSAFDPSLKTIKYLYNSRGFLWFLMGFGAVLRIIQYLHNRSLWQDEASLAINIITRSLSELLQQPLDYNQAAPVGFLVLEKLAVNLLGNSEYSLRLLPLLLGLVSIPLFYWVSVRYIRPGAVPLALGLFAISEYAVIYSSELKQYSGDIATTLLLLLLADHLYRKGLRLWDGVLFGFTGALAIWFSHPSIFVLAGVGTTLAAFYLFNKRFAELTALAVGGLFWVASFGINYFISIRHVENSASLQRFWSDGFMPLPPTALSELKWFYDKFFELFENPLDFRIAGIAALAFLTGCFVLLRKSKLRLSLLVGPVLIALLASGFHKFPFYGRLLLFIIPCLLFLIAEGALEVVANTKHNSPIIAILFMALLLVYPVRSAAYLIARPYYRAEFKPIMAFVEQHHTGQDIIYLYPDTQAAFMYYSEFYNLDNINYVKGIDKIDRWKDVRNQIAGLRGHERVWFIFSMKDDPGGQKVLIDYLENIGQQLTSIRRTGASAYLYDLKL